MTTGSQPIATPPAAAPQRVYYLELWRGVPRELLFLLLGLPIAIAGFVVTLTLFNTGVGMLIPLFIGVFILVGTMYAARGFANLELVRLDWAHQPGIRRVDWSDQRGGGGF